MTSLYPSLLDQLQQQLAILPDKSEETAELTLRALWAKSTGVALSAVAAQGLNTQELTASQRDELQHLIKRRLAGEPLAYITERQHFMGLEIKVTPDALIPRRETETLGHLALQKLHDIPSYNTPLILDICTGSGNIALAIAYHAPHGQVHGSDLSPAAVALARDNYHRLSIDYPALVGRVNFSCGDLLEPFRTALFLQQVDILICNPPYVIAANVAKMPEEIALFEPSMAFDGGPLGIAIIDRTLREAVEFLKPGAWLCLEVGAGQGPFVEKRLLKSGFYDLVETASDSAGTVRALAARKSL